MRGDKKSDPMLICAFEKQRARFDTRTETNAIKFEFA
jgi:hypothetical protein